MNTPPEVQYTVACDLCLFPVRSYKEIQRPLPGWTQHQAVRDSSLTDTVYAAMSGPCLDICPECSKRDDLDSLTWAQIAKIREPHLQSRLAEHMAKQEKK